MTAPGFLRACLALIASAFLLAACGGPTAARKSEADARMRMGVTYLGQRNLPMAMKELTRASQLDPTNPEIDMMLGLSYRERGDREKAEEHLRTAIDKKPDYAEAHNNLGIVLAGRQAWDEAIREFEMAAANVQYATPERAVYNAAEAYRSKGDAAKAEEQYLRALRINEQYAPAYLGLSSVYSNAGRWQDAEAVLLRCVKAVPDYPEGWLELGRVYAVMKRPTEAAKAFRTVLSVTEDPEIRKQAAGYLRVLEPEGR